MPVDFLAKPPWRVQGSQSGCLPLEPCVSFFRRVRLRVIRSQTGTIMYPTLNPPVRHPLMRTPSPQPSYRIRCLPLFPCVSFFRRVRLRVIRSQTYTIIYPTLNPPVRHPLMRTPSPQPSHRIRCLPLFPLQEMEGVRGRLILSLHMSAIGRCVCNHICVTCVLTSPQPSHRIRCLPLFPPPRDGGGEGAVDLESAHVCNRALCLQSYIHNLLF